MIEVNLSKDRRGGIEGLPLQLMIVILVATMGTGIIVGWMSNIEAPHTIAGVDVLTGDCKVSNGTLDDITILVTDQEGNPIPSAAVILTGLGVTQSEGGTVHGSTDVSGKVTFSGLSITETKGFGFITVNVSKSGYGEHNSTKVLVVS